MITDEQRLDAIDKIWNGKEDDFILEIQNFDNTVDGDSSIQMFTYDTQWIEGSSVRELLDKLVK